MLLTNNKNLPLVVIFGRTNVGKSTLFNKLTEKKQALVSGIAGTTRDANRGLVRWRGLEFELCDTGGIMKVDNLFSTKKITGAARTTDEIQQKIEEQARDNLSRADLILFLVDNASGLLPDDRETALALKKILGKRQDRVLLVVNKVDGRGTRPRAAEFNRLGLAEPMLVSAVTGAGTGDLLDEVVGRLPSLVSAMAKKTNPTDSAAKVGLDEEIKVLIIGKPNVGKSSLLNRLLGEERVIVSPIPHTTREPQDILLGYKDKTIRLIDSAGLSRRGRQKAFKDDESAKLIKYGILKTLGRLKEAHLVLFVLDINEEITRQDARILEEIIEAQKSIIIIANKWDLISEKDTVKFTNYIYGRLPFAAFAPVQFTSALTGGKVGKILDLVLEVAEQRKKEISASQLNTFLMKIVKLHKPAKGKGLKAPHIHEFKQTWSRPPRFSLRIGAKDDLHFSYVRFITNRLREKFGFSGTPIKIEVVKNKRVHGSHR